MRGTENYLVFIVKIKRFIKAMTRLVMTVISWIISLVSIPFDFFFFLMLTTSF